MSTPYQPVILPGDDINASPVGSVISKFHVVSVAGSQLNCTSSINGAPCQIAASSVRRVYRNGLLIWTK